VSDNRLGSQQIAAVSEALCAAGVAVVGRPGAADMLATLRAALVNELQEVNRSRNEPEADCGAARGGSVNRSPYKPSVTMIERELAPITTVLADLERRAKFVLDALLSAEHDLSFFHGLIATDCVEGPLSEKAVFFEIETQDTLKKLEAAIREFCGRDTGVGCDL